MKMPFASTRCVLLHKKTLATTKCQMKTKTGAHYAWLHRIVPNYKPTKYKYEYHLFRIYGTD